MNGPVNHLGKRKAVILIKVYNMKYQQKTARYIKFYTRQCLSHTSCMSSCSRFYCISDWFAVWLAIISLVAVKVRQNTEGGGTLEGNERDGRREIRRAETGSM